MINIKQIYTDNFLRYVKVPTASDSAKDTQYPSTQRQFVLANMLVEELKELGMEDVEITENCYVYGYLNKSNTNERVVLLAHMDVSEDAPSEDIKPIIHKFENKSIVLPHATIDISDLKNIKQGQEIITSDGSTLLGGDDKAGIAIITTLLKKIQQSKSSQIPSICVCFTPDEEIGNGTAKISLNKLTNGIKNAYALTIDGARENEIVFETFSARSFQITVHGFNIHPGYAYHKMCNSIDICSHLVTMINQKFRRPEESQKDESYVTVNDFSGEVSKSKICGIIRSFDDLEIENLSQQLTELVKQFEAEQKSKTYSDQFKIDIQVKVQYANMGKFISQQLKDKMTKLGEKYGCCVKRIRGGTDGSRLSVMGLQCPDVWNGTENFHSVKEYNVIDEAVQAVEYLFELIRSDIK